MDKTKRRSLMICLEPSEETPLAEVVDWLNGLDTQQTKEQIEELLTMTCLVLARAEAGAPTEIVAQSYWKMRERLEEYQSNIRQVLSIKAASLKPECSLVTPAEQIAQLSQHSLAQPQGTPISSNRKASDQAITSQEKLEPIDESCFSSRVSTAEIDALFESFFS